MDDNDSLEIVVDQQVIQVKNYISYADNQRFFAVGCNGNLYYNNNPEKKYMLLKANFRTPCTPKPDVFGIIKYDRPVNNNDS